MPLSPEEFFRNATQSRDESALRAQMSTWESFPFEVEGLRVRDLQAPHVPESPRQGEDPQSCRSCADAGRPAVWRNERWRLVARDEPSGAPLILLLGPLAHGDYGDLDDEMAEEMGRILAHVVRAVESLDHVARAHVLRFGDGSAHLHIFVVARPVGFAQLRGSFFMVWDDLLEPVPRDVRDRDAEWVGARLVETLGGSRDAAPAT